MNQDGVVARAAVDEGLFATAAMETPASTLPADSPDLAALCAIARCRQVAADPHHLDLQLGMNQYDVSDLAILERAPRHVGVKARLTRSRSHRLAVTPLSLQALMRASSEWLT